MKLKSCLSSPSQEAPKAKKQKKRVKWSPEETDNQRTLTFDVQELRILNENPGFPQNAEEKRVKKEKSKRKAESQDLKRKVDPSAKASKAEKKKNYSTKKDKLRKDIAKYFYHSDIMQIPGKENYSHAQKKYKKLGRDALQNKLNLFQTNVSNSQENFLKEKFFYKKKLKPKRRFDLFFRKLLFC